MIRLGTRSSPLAIAQAEHVAAVLRGNGHRVEIIQIRASGDENADLQDKAKWVDGLEFSLTDFEIDIAVHSAKDVPGQIKEGTQLVAVGGREDSRDILIGVNSLDELPQGAKIGTSSLRRASQLLSARRDLQIVPVRGNIQTRLTKLEEQNLDAIVLAAAALLRLGITPDKCCVLDDVPFVPAPGQGMLALQIRSNDLRVAAACTQLEESATTLALAAERACAALLQADCTSAVGIHCRPLDQVGSTLNLIAYVGSGSQRGCVIDQVTGDDPIALGRQLAERLMQAGAADLLHPERVDLDDEISYAMPPVVELAPIGSQHVMAEQPVASSRVHSYLVTGDFELQTSDPESQLLEAAPSEDQVHHLFDQDQVESQEPVLADQQQAELVAEMALVEQVVADELNRPGDDLANEPIVITEPLETVDESTASSGSATTVADLPTALVDQVDLPTVAVPPPPPPIDDFETKVVEAATLDPVTEIDGELESASHLDQVGEMDWVDDLATELHDQMERTTGSDLSVQLPPAKFAEDKSSGGPDADESKGEDE